MQRGLPTLRSHEYPIDSSSPLFQIRVGLAPSGATANCFAHLDDERDLVKSTLRTDFFGRARPNGKTCEPWKTVPILRSVCLLCVQCSNIELNNQATPCYCKIIFPLRWHNHCTPPDGIWSGTYASHAHVFRRLWHRPFVDRRHCKCRASAAEDRLQRLAWLCRLASRHRQRLDQRCGAQHHLRVV